MVLPLASVGVNEAESAFGETDQVPFRYAPTA
jgi:hypothetical protein